MDKKTQAYLEELWLIRNSNFPDDEKGRHYKEMLAQMRRHYAPTEMDGEQRQHFVNTYNLIVSMLNTPAAVSL